MSLTRRTRRRLQAMRSAGERGLTIVEVVVAGMILVISGLGVLGIVDAATRNTFRAEQSQVVANVLQREMEAIKQLPYAEVALATLPAQSGGANDPRSRISEATFDTAGDGTGYRPLVYDGSVNGGETVACAPNCLTSDPEPFQVDDVSGQVFRYVVWDDCDPSWLCEQDGQRFLKRVIVVVKLDATAPGGGSRRYQEVQGEIADPDAEPSDNPGPAPGGDGNANWTLWLTDTTCDSDSRSTDPESSHPTHNTRGRCEDGLQEGDQPGAPDLLVAEATPGVEDVIHDYATDVEPQPDADEGLQVMEGDSCSQTPAMQIVSALETGDMGKKIHKWVSPSIPAEATGLALTGAGALTLWSRIVGEIAYKGEICVWLFVRDAGGSTDTPVRNTDPLELEPTYFHYDHSQALWPSAWDEIAVPLFFEADTAEGGPVPLPEGSRLGIAVSVIVPEGEGTSGLQFLYDEPVFDSRIELDTTGTLPDWSP